MQIEPVAFIENDFKEKFGIPRQSGKVGNLSRVRLVAPYSSIEAVRELDGFSHVWLIFDFSLSHKENPSLTVRPPRLGGNKRVGVFASRSPYRPNSLGLSAVKLCKIETTAEGVCLIVEGADLLDGTPVYDIKPYLAYCDSIPNATDGFTRENADYYLRVETDCDCAGVDRQTINEIKQILREDPRPQYKAEGEKVYKMIYGKYDISFTVNNKTARIVEINDKKR